MAVDNIFQRYGIKEVADIGFYSIDEETGGPGKLELYIDTAKTSTIEQTAESVDARGGKGNPALISWDYGKEITVTLEDALFSAKSMEMMFGKNSKDDDTIVRSFYNHDINIVENKDIEDAIAKSLPELENGESVGTAAITIVKKYNRLGQDVTNVTQPTEDISDTKPYLIHYVFEKGVVDQHVIKVDASTFPGTYYIIGDTYARNETTGKDEFFQFIIPKAKMNVENTLTLQAEGDPTVFNMSLKVLRPANGTMMKLIKYSLTEEAAAADPETESTDL